MSFHLAPHTPPASCCIPPALRPLPLADESFERLLEVTGAAGADDMALGAPGVNVQHTGKGATSLMAAAVHGRADIVSVLLSNGVSEGGWRGRCEEQEAGRVGRHSAAQTQPKAESGGRAGGGGAARSLARRP